MNEMEGTAQERLKDLFAKHPFPPLDVIIPIFENAGRGERELSTQIYNSDASLANGIKEILGFKGKDMRTLAKVWEILSSFGGQKLQPIILDESRFSFSISECPMLHVGNDVSSSVKSKFCDLICTSGSKAIMDTILGQGRATCSWNKALIEGAGKCTVTYRLLKPQ
jgi:hypothetical protein